MVPQEDTTAFYRASDIEAMAYPAITEWLISRGSLKNVRPTSGAPYHTFLQKNVGDFTAELDGVTIGIEVKAEAVDKYGNFYLESWSNKKTFNPGWMYTSKARSLIYYFLKSRELYAIDFWALKRWAFGDGSPGNIYAHPEREQAKYDQKNDTWGWCVPITTVQAALDAQQDGSVPEEKRFFRSYILPPSQVPTLDEQAAAAAV